VLLEGILEVKNRGSAVLSNPYHSPDQRGEAINCLTPRGEFKKRIKRGRECMKY